MLQQLTKDLIRYFPDRHMVGMDSEEKNPIVKVQPLGLKLCRKIGSSGTDVQTSQPISKHIGGVGNAASNLLGALVKL